MPKKTRGNLSLSAPLILYFDILSLGTRLTDSEVLTNLYLLNFSPHNLHLPSANKFKELHCGHLTSVISKNTNNSSFKKIIGFFSLKSSYQLKQLIPDVRMQKNILGILKSTSRNNEKSKLLEKELKQVENYLHKSKEKIKSTKEKITQWFS